MPLASSAPKERLSLPATIDSTTKATRPKAIKRRHSLRSKRASSPAPHDKENENQNRSQSSLVKNAPTSPGPTPYFMVAAERELKGENPHSPRVTRSAQKKKPRLPPREQMVHRAGSRGIALSFSPPDQEANRRREVEALAKKNAEFERRVQSAKASGRYLVFSPNSGKPLQSFDDGDITQMNVVDHQASRKDEELIRLVGGQQEAIQTLEGQMNHFLTMQTKSFDEGSKFEQLAEFQAKNAHLVEVNVRLEEAMNKVEREKQELLDQIGMMKDRLLVETTKHETEIVVARSEARSHQAEKDVAIAKFDEAKEQHLIERTRMESEIESLKRESNIRLTGLGESRKGLEEEKQKLYSRVEELEIKLLHSKDQYTDMKATQSKLHSDKEHLVEAKSRLASELEKVTGEKQTLQQQVSNLKQELHVIQTSVMPAGEAKYDAIVKKLEIQQMATLSTETKLKEAGRTIDTLNCELQKLENEKQDERVTFQKLNEDSAKAFGKLERDLDERNTQIDDLKKELDVLAADLEVEQQNRQALERELQQQVDETNKAIEELENQADDLVAEIEQEKAIREEFEKQLQQKEAKMAEIYQQKQTEIIALSKDVEYERQRAKSTQELLDHSNAEWEQSFASVKAEGTQLAADLESRDILLQKIELQLNNERVDATSALRERQAHIEILEDKLALSDTENSLLNEKCATMNKDIEALTAAQENVLGEKSDVQTSLSAQKKRTEQLVQTIESLRSSLSETQLQLKEVKTKLECSQFECEKAHSRMGSFDDREAELFRKLGESDRIRRDLHAKVMQLSGNIRVFVRVRPELPGEKEKEINLIDIDQSNNARKRKHVAIEDTTFKFPGMFDIDGNAEAEDLCKNLVEVTEPPKDRGGLRERKKKWRFGFDNVFSPSQGQEEIWQATEPLVQSAIDGFNVCIFAYGQTGSGKTYTMLGDEQNKGIIYRAVEKLFESKLETETLSKGRVSVSISVELLEVYNEKIRDLLSSNLNNYQGLKVTSTDVEGNILATTNSVDEFMRILEIAQSRRCVKATNSNAESSRSHMVITMHFNVTGEGGASRNGKVHVCDLAGSERLSKSGANGSVKGSLMQETKSINSSLSVLSNVIERLQQGNPNVPFRESKLTMLLQNSLGGNSKTLAIVCCNPLASHFHESLCSLRFADKVNKVELRASSNFSC